MKKKNGLFLGVLIGSMVGCGDMFTVDNPTDILDEDLNDIRYADALANSAEGALSLIYDNAVRYGELAADGIMHVSNRRENVQLDQGDFEGFNGRTEVVWDQLSMARFTATEVTERLEELLDSPHQDMRVARTYFWDGIARLTLADYFREIPLDGGPPNSPTTIYEQAIDLLTTAGQIAATAGHAPYEAAAHGSMARAYRSLYFEGGAVDGSLFDRAAENAERALAVQPEFRMELVYAPPGTHNNLGTGLRAAGAYDIMESTWANATDPATGTRDPRIVHGPFDGLSAFGDSIYEQQKYTNASDPISVSRWQEAKLIVAEHRLMLGDLDGAVAAINDVRRAAGLPDLATVDAEGIRSQLIYERGAEFWLEGRRWQDLRYYGVVPPRWSAAMAQRGVDRRWAVSLREQGTNPHYQP